jgi:type I restriction enzyme M protein
MARDKASLDIFWLKDDSLDKLDDLPPPDVLQQEIIDHLEAALQPSAMWRRQSLKS